MKILFFGDDRLAVLTLEHLLALNHEILAVVLRRFPRNDELRSTAIRYGLQVFQPERVNAESFLTVVRALCPDFNLSINYDQIFRKKLIESASLGTINCHNGLLPNYRGGGGLYGALINNERYFGQTVHFMNEGIDTGDIIIQDVLPINFDDSIGVLIERATHNAPQLIVRALSLIEQGQYVPRSQVQVPGSYFPKKPEGDEVIDWNEPSLLIYNKIRGRNPGPGNVTFLGSKKVIVWTASLTDIPDYIAPVGQVIGVAPGQGVLVKTSDNAIRIEQVEIEGEKGHKVARFNIGTTFLANWRQAYLDLNKKYAVLERRLERLEQQVVIQMKEQLNEGL